ncbi:hypothetical protein K1Y78_47975 [Streptomyces sp. tea 10]|nr:hypothetical protein [Streptomyces sp. tea 10]
MRFLRTLLITAAVGLTCASCEGTGSGGDSKPSQSPSSSKPSALSTPSQHPTTAAPKPSPAAVLFPGHQVHQSDNGVIASKASWGNGWPWKTPSVVMACSDAVSGGAYLNAANGENYLLTGTIARPGFVTGNAGTDLWNGDDAGAYGEWLDAAKKLCPKGG